MSRLRHRSRRKNKQRKIIIISICSILLFMSAGYAAMSTNLEIDAKGNVIKKASGAENILNNANIVTNGDGLYKDAYEENVYTYRGESPNNYVTFNGETAGWRIISINTSDNTIKIIRNINLIDMYYDLNNNRNNGDYCNSSGSYDCNIWGSSSTLYNNNLVPITQAAREIGGTKYNLPDREASLNVYLNEEYYSGLNEMAKEMIKKDAIYKVGPIYYTEGQELSIDISNVSQVKWKGKIALIDATEYIRASTNPNCINLYDGSWYNRNYPCKNNNWMFNNNYWWTLSPLAISKSFSIMFIDTPGYINSFSADSFNYPLGVRPVVTLSPNVKVSGSGTVNDPYNFSLN